MVDLSLIAYFPVAFPVAHAHASPPFGYNLTTLKSGPLALVTVERNQNSSCSSALR